MWYKQALKEYHSGVMIAFYLNSKVAKKLHDLTKKHVSKPEPIKEFHMTLAFLGDKSEVNEYKNAILKAMKQLAKKQKTPIKGKVSGIGLFSNAESDGKRALYASLDCPGLPEFRQEIVEALSDIKGLSIKNNHGFTPHCTLAYLPENEEIPPIDIPLIDVEFNELAISWGESEYVYKLGN